MTAGLTVWNTWGTVQVDDTWANLSLRYKVQVNTTVTGVNGSRGYEGTLTLPCDTPLLFMKPTASACIKACQNNGNGTWTWTFGTLDPATITTYVFDKPVWLAQSFGLEIYDANGNKTFGDQHKPLRVAGVVQPGAASVQPINFYETPWIYAGLPAGSYAVCASNPGSGEQLAYDNAEAQFSQALYAGIRDRQDGCQMAYVPVASIPGDASPGSFVPPQFIIIADVMGL
ncbi:MULTISPECIES: hypothetical protein [Cupriavidus]|uniref:Uncharacterized protein n=1 Tax=Cupriavidus nantongensis TaxID=1796606 RepID=A0A142JMZ6_9BURK|nr:MULTISPECIES: hypothetical protein [Cupriavidus]AMR79458.1 hypothetical protein A2G96_17870 [Cupriavidus nantongensis]SPA50614.1 protein of unknown function [Cupriavidus taiwanensis]